MSRQDSLCVGEGDARAGGGRLRRASQRVLRTRALRFRLANVATNASALRAHVVVGGAQLFGIASTNIRGLIGGEN